ncbi:MAG: Spy/CpxP family protein refolding chaperone [Gammaproteobacteria bacterium]
MFKQMLIVPLAALALAAGAGYAQASANSDAGPTMSSGMQHHSRSVDLSQLKTQLKITSSQEGAWDGFVSALKAMHPHKPMHHAPPSGTAKPLPAPQVFSMMAQHAQDFAGKAQQLSSAAEALYQMLTPTQQTVLNTHLAEMHAKMEQRHRHWKEMRKSHKAAAPATGG